MEIMIDISKIMSGILCVGWLISGVVNDPFLERVLAWVSAVWFLFIIAEFLMAYFYYT